MTCRYCLATYGDIYDGEDCGHGEREQAVAKQLATFVHGDQATDKLIGGFMEDAELVCSVVKDPEPKVTHYNARYMRFRVNDHKFKVDDDGYLMEVSR